MQKEDQRKLMLDYIGQTKTYIDFHFGKIQEEFDQFRKDFGEIEDQLSALTEAKDKEVDCNVLL